MLGDRVPPLLADVEIIRAPKLTAADTDRIHHPEGVRAAPSPRWARLGHERPVHGLKPRRSTHIRAYLDGSCAQEMPANTHTGDLVRPS